jgi:chitinase
MSAFFQQSALYENHQPTTSPTVSWINHLERPIVLARPPEAFELVERATDEIDGELRESRGGTFRMVPPRTSGAGGGLRRLIRIDLGWPAHVYAPYVDMTASPTFDFVESATSEGILYYNLASIYADADRRPCWGGDSTRGVDGGAFDRALRDQIHELRALGGDVSVTFGGPLKTSLAEAIDNVDELKQAYRTVIDAYGLSRIDFDLSGPMLDNHAAIERNWHAVGELQREMAELGTPLEVWVTVPTTNKGPATNKGLSDAALDAVRSAGQNGVDLDGVNLKTEYDETQATDKNERPGRQAIETTTNAYYQLRRTLLPDAKTGQVWVKIGITPVIDGQPTAFGTKDAREVYGFAEQQRVGMVSVWSLNGDPKGAGQPSASTESNQQPESDGLDVSEIFSDFGKLMP